MGLKEEQKIKKESLHRKLMDLKELDAWFSMQEYDPEGKELDTIIRLGKIKDKDVLVLGLYGVMHISFKLFKNAKSITAIHSSRKIINCCENKNTKISFKVGNLDNLKIADKSFDVIISAWNGLHYNKNKVKIVDELNRVLRDNGILVVEEADETSEYVDILNLIVPKNKQRIKSKRDELINVLKKIFKLKESKLRTYYYFKDRQQLKGYFKKEIVFGEKKEFTKNMDKKLDDFLIKKRTFKVEEKSVFLKCMKKL